MTDIRQGVTKEETDVPYISFAQFIPVYVEHTQARPNKQ